VGAVGGVGGMGGVRGVGLGGGGGGGGLPRGGLLLRPPPLFSPGLVDGQPPALPCPV